MHAGNSILFKNLIAKTFVRLPIITQVIWSTLGTVIFYFLAISAVNNEELNFYFHVPGFIVLAFALAYDVFLVVSIFQSTWKQFIIVPLAVYNVILIYGIIRIIVNIALYRNANGFFIN